MCGLPKTYNQHVGSLCFTLSTFYVRVAQNAEGFGGGGGYHNECIILRGTLSE